MEDELKIESEEESEDKNSESEESEEEFESVEEEPLENIIEESSERKYPRTREKISPWLEAEEMIPAENLEKELRNQVTPAKPEIENEPQYSSKTYQTMGKDNEQGYPRNQISQQFNNFNEPFMTQNFNFRGLNMPSGTMQSQAENRIESGAIREEKENYKSNFEQSRNRRRF